MSRETVAGRWRGLRVSPEGREGSWEKQRKGHREGYSYKEAERER